MSNRSVNKINSSFFKSENSLEPTHRHSPRQYSPRQQSPQPYSQRSYSPRKQSPQCCKSGGKTMNTNIPTICQINKKSLAVNNENKKSSDAPLEGLVKKKIDLNIKQSIDDKKSVRKSMPSKRQNSPSPSIKCTPRNLHLQNMAAQKSYYITTSPNNCHAETQTMNSKTVASVFGYSNSYELTSQIYESNRLQNIPENCWSGLEDIEDDEKSKSETSIKLITPFSKTDLKLKKINPNEKKLRVIRRIFAVITILSLMYFGLLSMSLKLSDPWVLYENFVKTFWIWYDSILKEEEQPIKTNMELVWEYLQDVWSQIMNQKLDEYY